MRRISVIIVTIAVLFGSTCMRADESEEAGEEVPADVADEDTAIDVLDNAALERDQLLSTFVNAYESCETHPDDINLTLATVIYLMHPLFRRGVQCIRSCVWKRMNIMNTGGELLEKGFINWMKMFGMKENALGLYGWCNNSAKIKENCDSAEIYATCIRIELQEVFEVPLTPIDQQ